ncbi:unnamed protein product [Brassicogethes aeneus]|uniref:Serine/threonine-protein kinase RIO1 n=1 Tax=Brassicogethes aeneus TaxID=1431903 RepID=A0A9P0B9M8_BRAAE|nr:unnamed protein product [Brassicogethes aeneus]
MTAINEEELYCDAEEDIKDKIRAVKIVDTPEKDYLTDEDEYYDSYEDDYYDDGCYAVNKNPQQASTKVNNFQPADNLFKKYSNKINVEKYESNIPCHATNLLLENQRKMANERIRTKDKHDRATVEQVMDPRTRMILFKMLNTNLISQINGCISTGKEANVYHASSNTDKQFAIKIYKTSILVFKDRDKYVSGEFRFRHGYCKHNPRKMVRTWAEKEMRNLVRMHSNGLKTPEPVLLRSHVLLMTFIGKDGWPAPKLKDVEISQSKSREIYREIVVILWKMYNKCKLVHADLSEYNMLYHNGEIYIIDVSQSVEHDHPHALEFLRKDCTNITDFFKKKDVATMGIKDLFDFITDPSINESNMDECLEKLSEKASEREEITSNEQVEEEVFKQAYIPQRLTEVIDFERDINKAKSGQSDDLVYKTLVGLKADLSGTVQQPEILQNDDEKSDEDTDSSDEVSDEEHKSGFRDSSRPKDESLEDKKNRKKAYDQAFRPKNLKNWEVPKAQNHRPAQKTGPTKIISNSRGHLLPNIPKIKDIPWSGYYGAWDLPKKINRKTANEINGLGYLRPLTKKKHEIIQEIINNAEVKNIPNPVFKNEDKKDDEIKAAVPYVPGDFTDEKHVPTSHSDLEKRRFKKEDSDFCKGFPRVVNEDFTTLPEEKVDITKEAEKMYNKHREILCMEPHHYQEYDECNNVKAKKHILATMSNFCLAKRLHKENLEHEPLPDTITHNVYRKLQMQGELDPGLGIEADNRVTGIGWKEYGGYGPTRCTKLRVFRPKTCVHNKIINQHENRPSSVSSFDKKWRFIKQWKVSPIDLAICWDLTPENPKDEPKRTNHIDGNNDSQAPAVFTLVHTPKENDPKTPKEVKCDGVHACGPLFEHRNNNDDTKKYFFERPKTTASNKSSVSSVGSKKRSKSATNINETTTSSPHSNKSLHKSIPDLFKPKTPTPQCQECFKVVKHKTFKHCMACQMKNVSLKEKKPKSEFKQAFKAGLPLKKSVSTFIRVKLLPIPRQKNPYSRKSYEIVSLAPPFSLQNQKRTDYPEHWRLASVYQQSYKPLELRKKPLLATVYK